MTDEDILKIASLYDLRMRDSRSTSKIYNFTREGFIKTVRSILYHEQHLPNVPVSLESILAEIFEEHGETK